MDTWHRGGSGEPLVCIHGFTDTWRTWTPILPALEQRHDVLAVTLAGHTGGVPLPPEGLEAGTLADQVERDMDANGFETAHLVGSSLGGWAALELAGRGRGRGRSVVGLSPAGGWEKGSAMERRTERLFRRIRLLLRIGAPRAELIASRPRLRALALRDMVTHGERIPPALAVHMMRSAEACPAFEPLLELLHREGFPGLDPIACPVRLAWGTRDRVLPARLSTGRLLSLVPEAELVELPGLGHLPMHDDPALVVRTILEVTQAAERDVAQPAPA